MRHPFSHETQRQMKEAQLARVRNPNLADVVERNICTVLELRQEAERNRSQQDRASDAITAFSGSMLFVYLHLIWFGVWIALNLGWLGLRPFDPFPFGLLTMIVSLEAIFLSTFVLISQNRMSLAADKRADLDLQINLLAEYEITRILTLVDAMADRMGIEEAQDRELDQLKKDVTPEIVLKEMKERAEEQAPPEKHGRHEPRT
jgi:uncharacterized membrane protein